MKLKFTIFLTCLLSVCAFPSCTDDLETKRIEETNPGNVTLLIPVSGEATGSRADGQLESQEGNLKDLYLYVFKLKAGGVATTDSDYEIFPINGQNVNEIKDNLGNQVTSGYKGFSLQLEEGTYRFYLLGNVFAYTSTSLGNLTTISAIKSLNLSFTRPIQVNDGLPMACLSSVYLADQSNSTSASNDSSVTLTAAEINGGKKIYCDMHFLCSKVRYTIQFDNTQPVNGEGGGVSKNFGTHVMDLNNTVEVNNVANSTNINVSYSDWTDKYLPDNANSPFTGGLKQFKFNAFPTNTVKDWTEDDSHAWDSNKNKCAWQGVIYLPENTNTDYKSKLKFTGQCQLSSSNPTKIYDFEETVELMPVNNGSNQGISRSHLYDLFFKFQEYDGIDIKVSVMDWVPEMLMVDFEHTYLEIERTEASVTSILDDVLTFNSDGRGGFKLDCYNPENLTNKTGTMITTPVIILGEVNEEEHTLTLSANSALNIDEISPGGLKGTATCYIKAGNITKQIKVKYDLEAFFTVTPESITFNMGDMVNNQVPPQQFHFETNLGGIKLFKSNEAGVKSGSELNLTGTNGVTDQVTIVNVGSDNETSTITLKCEKTDTNEGNLTVTVPSSWNCTHVAHHYFWAQPVTTYEDIQGQLIMVSVIPSQGNYRVYFRAINDYQAEWGFDYDNKSGIGYANIYLEDKWDLFPEEDYSAGTSTSSESENWKDWWDNFNTKNTIDDKGRHNIYIYGQIGETGDGFNPKDKWDYNNYDDGDQMSGDFTNPGWYFRDLSPSWSVTSSYLKNDEPITPGRTLFIFHNRSHGCALHRCSHHNDPGVPLFNYEDREGWYLYDPTREPYYNVYDDKPVIEDVIYQFYLPGKPTQWYRDYGVASGNSSYDTHTTYRMYGNITETSSSSIGLGKTYKSGDYYVTQLKFKAPKDDYSKNIKFSFPGYGIPENRIYIYVDLNKDDQKWMANPKAHISKDQNSTYEDWFSPKENMTRVGSTNYYYYDIPEGYENGYLIFHGDGGQFPGDKQGWIQMKPGHNYQNSGSLSKNVTAWIPYTGSKPLSSTTITTTLMGGNNYTPVNVGNKKIIYGYYKDGKWHKGQP